MLLSDISAHLPCKKKRLYKDCTIHDIQRDSRHIEEGDVFVSIPGTQTDGHRYIDNAIQRGAVGIVVSENYDCSLLPNSISYWVVSSSAQAWSLLSQAWFQYPASRLKMIAITGTSGKTSSAHIVYQMLQSMGEKAVLIGTGGIFLHGHSVDYTMKGAVTTPDPKELHYILSKAVEEGCSFGIVEASSHGLAQERLFGVALDAVFFVSLSPCHHIEYHQSEERYIRAKERIFSAVKKQGLIIINKDAELYSQMHIPSFPFCVTISLFDNADYRLFPSCSIKENAQRSEHRFTLQGHNQSFHLSTKLPGEFQMYNIGAAFLIGKHFGLPLDLLSTALENIDHIPGRWHLIPTTLPLTVVVDKANVLLALRYFRKEIESRSYTRRILVFGNVGGGLKSSRANIGTFFCSFFDDIFLTLDDPETEDPTFGFQHFMSILSIKEAKKVMIIEDRKKAIQKAIDSAPKGAIVAILGRGNQKEYLVQGGVQMFDDVEVTKQVIRDKENHVSCNQ
ncbi:MAG: UDP-N-acetylmuramyl-tripeptide synthetase [Caldisericia bacterium]|nr:UDP-N-acetylmuramyl-tripeptide synthetase [Caldisericia bacterium]MDD4613937.1 UDP-N-acetylmuramyl-tripeptide synthetase [Caldisericia bacterium]